MRPRTYLLWTFASALAVFLMWTAVFCFSLGSRLEDGRWVAECLDRKRAAADHFQPKLVILSGSGALFGFSARELSQSTGLSVVNAGLHAGLGLDYLLYSGRSYIAPGRVLVLPLEYELYQEWHAEITLCDQVLGYDPGYFWQLGLGHKLDFLLQIPVSTLWRHFRSRISPYPLSDSIYQSRTLNEWGDETRNSPSLWSEEHVVRIRKAGPGRYTCSKEAWASIQRFVREAEAHGCRVVLAYPSICGSVFKVPAHGEFFSSLRKAAALNGMRYLGEPDDFIFPEGEMLDTVYHSSSVAQSRNTRKLYERLYQAGLLPAGE